MIKYGLFAILLSSPLVLAESGADLLIKGSGSLDQSVMIKKSATLTLDNAFLVQFYGAWRGLNNNQSKISNFVELVLAKKDSEAFKELLQLSDNLNARELEIKDATELYLLYRLGFTQSFTNRWIDTAAKESFLNSSFGIALDEVFANESGSWFIKNGIYLSTRQRSVLGQVSHVESKLNTLIQAYSALRDGERAFDLIGKLGAKDPLRLRLADTAVLDFARRGELGKAGSLLKEVYTPALIKTKNLDKLSNYHIKLARLLYQAGAYEASEYYYSLIPREANGYLTAKTESLWISLRSRNSSQIKGDLRTLDLDLFSKHFIPEVYLVSSIANLRLCQFTEVDKAFSAFVDVNRKYAKDIEQNVNSTNPAIIDKEDFYLKLALSGAANIELERSKLAKFLGSSDNTYILELNDSIGGVTNSRVEELKRKWTNREKILATTIKRMRFVKVEYLSQMRRLNKIIMAGGLKDSVRTVASGIEKKSDLNFPHDGLFFADELFSVSSEVKDLCLRSKK